MSDYKSKKRNRRRKGPTYIAAPSHVAVKKNGKIHYVPVVKDRTFPKDGHLRFCKITNCEDCGGNAWFKKETRLPKKYRRGKKRRIHRQAL